MECKFLLDPMILPPITELIDTLWNVNKDIHPYWLWESTELIDTLWNVNFLAPMLYSVIPLN